MTTKIKYELWRIPTEEGKRAFKWKPKLIKTYTTIEDSEDAKYFEETDECAPDWRDYVKYEIRKIET